MVGYSSLRAANGMFQRVDQGFSGHLQAGAARKVGSGRCKYLCSMEVPVSVNVSLKVRLVKTSNLCSPKTQQSRRWESDAK